jgi:hypothetical protein
MTYHTACVLQASKHVLSLQPGITFQNGIYVVPNCQHVEHVLHREPTTTSRLLERLGSRPEPRPSGRLLAPAACKLRSVR